MTDSWNAEYMNNREHCIVCFQPPKIEEMHHGLTATTPLIKHHVTYFPEKIAFVHYECHKKIHGDPPSKVWIQYKDGDARKFYAMKQERENGQVDTKDKA